MQPLIINNPDKYPQYEKLTVFFIQDSYEDFCKEYEVQFKKGNNLYFDIKNFSIRTVEENLKYIEFMLSIQKRDYSISYIEYLMANSFTNEIIKFFNNLKEIPHNSKLITFASLCKEIKIDSQNEIIKILAKNQNLILFKFFYENETLIQFKDKDVLWKEILQTNFKKAIIYLAPEIDNVYLFMLDHIINKLLILYEKKDEMSFYCNYLKIENQNLLEQIIAEYEFSTSNYNRTLIELDSPYQICCLGLESVPPKVTIITLNSKEDINHQTDNVSKLIWQKYHLEKQLPTKEQMLFKKANKI